MDVLGDKVILPDLSHEELALLLELGKRLVSELALERVLTLVAETACQVVHAETLVVPIIDPERQTFTYRAASGKYAEMILGQTFPIYEGTCGWVIQHQRPLLFGENESFDLDANAHWQPGMASNLLVPLICRGTIAGGLSAMGKQGGGAFNQRDLTVLTLFANQASIAFDNARLFQNLSEEKATVSQLNAELEQRVWQRTAQLEAANKELETFSYSVSHDLRTPLRAIDGFSSILLDDYADKLDEEGKRLLNVVRDNTSRMEQLIDDILQFSRSSRLEMTFSEIDMGKLAHEVVKELQPAVANSKLRVDIEPIPPATGDRAMMHQVFVNLLSNAIKFSSTRESAMIKVGGAIEGDEAVYYVKDNGAGFDMQYADKLFGVFQRLHAVNEFEGTGIGLAIVQRIITRHGGRVWAEGKVNEGATIYFALPAKKNNHE
jgi:signal transduction histidine kinase